MNDISQALNQNLSLLHGLELKSQTRHFLGWHLDSEILTAFDMQYRVVIEQEREAFPAADEEMDLDRIIRTELR